MTLEGLRRRFQPVEPADFMQFLLNRHRITGDVRWGGSVGCREAVGQLQGFEDGQSLFDRIIAAIEAR